MVHGDTMNDHNDQPQGTGPEGTLCGHGRPASGPIKALLIETAETAAAMQRKISAATMRRPMRMASAASVAEASEKLKQETFDLIIAAINLPDARGIGTFRLLRAAAPAVPIVLLIDPEDEGEAVKAMREGVQDYLIRNEITANLLLRAAAQAIERNNLIQEWMKLINDFTGAVSRIKILSRLLPICAGCKKIRNDKGYWEQVEQYLREHSDVDFTHGFCPECMTRLYPGFAKEQEKKNK
jgi:CheY-like chemotaxis protein